MPESSGSTMPYCISRSRTLSDASKIIAPSASIDGVFDQIKFIVNFSDHLFDHIFERDDDRGCFRTRRRQEPFAVPRARNSVSNSAADLLSGTISISRTSAAQIKRKRGPALLDAAIAFQQYAEQILDVNEADDVIERAM